MPLTPEIRIYDTDDARQPLPDKFIQGWEFELVDRGGCGTFSLTLAAELDDQALPAVPEGDWRVEFRLDGTLVYRGWALQASGGIQDGGGPYKLMGVGRMDRCGKILADAAYAKVGGADIGEIYGWLAGKYLVGSERLGEFAAAVQTDTGYTVERAEFFGATVREAFDRMADAAAGLIVWGWDTTAAGADRLYVKLRPTTVPDTQIFRVGGNVAYYQQPSDLSELVNAIRLVGGSAKAPNLLFNPSWELPAVPGDDASGNLFTNPSFESTTGWTFNPSSASIRQASGGEPGEYARTGSWLAELDDSGDSVQQTVTLPATGADQKYRLVIHRAKEFANQTPVIKVKVEELNSANVVQATLVDDTVTDANLDTYGRITSTARSYEKWEKELLTTDADTTKLRVTITRHSDATIIDDVYLFQDTAVQEGWTTRGYGGWKGKVLWACDEVEPFHGVYCLKATVTSGTTPGTDARNYQITPTQERWLSAREQTSYVLKIRVRGAAGLKLKLGMYSLKGGGGYSTLRSSEFTLAGTGTWETFSATLASGAGSQIRPFLELRSQPGIYYLDAFEVYESGLENRADADFLDGEALVYTFRAGDLRSDLEVHASDAAKVKSPAAPFTTQDVGKVLRVTGGAGWTTGNYNLTAFDGTYVTLHTTPAATGTTGGAGGVIISSGISDAAMNSIATYGLREAVVEVSEITELAQAKDYAVGYFNRYAIPLIRGQLALEPAEQVLRYVGTDVDATPTGMIGLRGAEIALPDQFPVRIVYSLTKEGAVRCEVDLTNRRPDRNLLLKKALGGKTSGGGYGGGGSNLRPGPGNSGSGGENGLAPTWRVNNTDIGARSSLNLRAGPGMTIAGTDDETNDEVEALFTSTASTRPTDLAFFAQTTAITVNNPGSGETEIASAARKKFDLTDFTEARVGAYVSTPGSTGTQVRIQYSTNGGSSWAYLDGSSGPGVAIDTTSVYAIGAWVTLAAGAKADVLLRAVVHGGDGVADPNIFQVHMQAR